MVEWNGILRLFRFSGILSQPREVHPKFRNEIPENVCSIRSQTRNFRNFWSNGKRPFIPGFVTMNRAPVTWFTRSSRIDSSLRSAKLCELTVAAILSYRALVFPAFRFKGKTYFILTLVLSSTSYRFFYGSKIKLRN